MDLNYLYHRQQVSLFRSENASCERSRSAHRQLAAGYETMIRQAKAQAQQRTA